VHISTLDDDMYNHVEKQHSLIGRRQKKVYRIGDKARVKVAAVIPATRRIEFVLVGHTPSTLPARPTVIPGSEEYPRIPIRGKQLSNVKRTSSGNERSEPHGKERRGEGKHAPGRKRR
jgi:ribonuclease R